jgi:hypothetical protein
MEDGRWRGVCAICHLPSPTLVSFKRFFRSLVCMTSGGVRQIDQIVPRYGKRHDQYMPAPRALTAPSRLAIRRPKHPPAFANQLDRHVNSTQENSTTMPRIHIWQ